MSKTTALKLKALKNILAKSQKKISPDDLFADLRGRMKVKGDINEPASKIEDWNALS